MNFKLRLLLIVLLSLLLPACMVGSPSKPLASIQITPPEQNRIRFTGKGAGAGMMLMSSMGPMGMAVGVAIDEGIAKDIHETAVAEGVDFVEILTANLQQGLQASDDHKISSIEIKIERYGFKTIPGENDPCVVDVELTYSINGGEWRAFASSKEHSDESKDAQQQAPLEQLKTDGETTRHLFRQLSNRLTKMIKSSHLQ